MAKKGTFSDVGDDVMLFKQLLIKHMNYEFMPNLHEKLEAVISKTKAQTDGFSYKVVKLQFKNLNLGKKIRPILPEDKIRNAVIEMTLDIDYCYPVKGTLDDAIQEFSLQIVIKISDEDSIVVKSSWHFDRHPCKNDDSTNANTPEFHHPLYHLHFGGKELTEESDLAFGNLFVLEAPRIMHPPMDIILATDFILGNFYSKEKCEPYCNLLKEPKYLPLIRKAQERMWKSFFFGVSSNFTNFNLINVGWAEVNPTYAKNLFAYSQEH